MFENMDKLMEELTRLQEAYELLGEVYSEIGPYGFDYNGEKTYVSDELRRKLNRFFDFDDNE